MKKRSKCIQGTFFASKCLDLPYRNYHPPQARCLCPSPFPRPPFSSRTAKLCAAALKERPNTAESNSARHVNMDLTKLCAAALKELCAAALKERPKQPHQERSQQNNSSRN